MTTTEPLAPGDRAPDLTVTNHEQDQFPLSHLWGERHLVLLFLRHLG